MSPSVTIWLDSALSVFIPRRCPICGTTLLDPKRGWCMACESGMFLYDRPICTECRRFIPRGASACEVGHAGAEPAMIYALGAFDGAYGTMAHAIKYDGYRELARPLGKLLGESITDSGATEIIAVPTSPKKFRKRGFGHAEEIAAACSKTSGLNMIPGALEFTRAVADQTKLNATERSANLRGALTVRTGLHLDGLHVLIVDDVMTTGSTIREAARAVKEAGAESVTGAVVAVNLSMQDRSR